MKLLKTASWLLSTEGIYRNIKRELITGKE